jgi:hypothetical protein
MENFYEILRDKFGDHSEAARQLGITPRQFRRIRSGQQKPTESLLKLIKKIIEEKKAA